jgi:hypothetical protein
MEIGPGRSAFLAANVVATYPHRLERATTTFETLKRVYAVENPVPIDQLDVVR